VVFAEEVLVVVLAVELPSRDTRVVVLGVILATELVILLAAEVEFREDLLLGMSGGVLLDMSGSVEWEELTLAPPLEVDTPAVRTAERLFLADSFMTAARFCGDGVKKDAESSRGFVFRFVVAVEVDFRASTIRC
jgi:hypothetical protein